MTHTVEFIIAYYRRCVNGPTVGSRCFKDVQGLFSLHGCFMLLPLHWDLSESDPAVGDRTEVVPQRLDPVDEAKIEAFSGRRRSTGGDGVKGGGPMWVEIRVLQEAPVKGNFKGHGFDENNGRFPDIFSKMPKARVFAGSICLGPCKKVTHLARKDGELVRSLGFNTWQTVAKPLC